MKRYFYDEAALQRRYPEGPKRAERSEFERDLSRLKHSFGLRRLSGVTQVFQSDGRRTVRNRFSHSIEVADIAATLAVALGPDPDLVASAALAHDLGHPPFGHHGEHVLDEFAQSVGIDGFEGNAQTLRVLTKLEPKYLDEGQYRGMNPTRALADATLKYPWTRGEGSGRKFGYYMADRDTFAWARAESFEGVQSVEAQLMEWADDVAYCTHDLEDGILAGFIPVAELHTDAEREALCREAATHSDVSEETAHSAYERVLSLPEFASLRDSGEMSANIAAPGILKKLTGALIDRFVDTVVLATRVHAGGQPIGRYDGQLVVPREIRAEAEVLRAMTWRHVILSERFRQQRAAQLALLTEVLERVQRRRGLNIEGADTLFRIMWAQADDERKVLDAVAALTDQGVGALVQS